MIKSLRMAAIAAGMLALAGASASAADFKLANPAAGANFVTPAAMVVAPLASENPVIKTQRRVRGARVGRVGGGRIVRGGRGGRVLPGRRRGRGIGKGVAIGLGVLGAAAIIGAAGASAGSGPSCSRLAYLCEEEGRGWACDRFARRCE